MLSSTFKSPARMPSWTDELIRKSLLAEDIVDVHFHLFSRRSKSRVLYPRALNTNTALLKSSAKYFVDLFSSDEIPSHATMVNVRTTDVIFDGVDLEDYGYGSDSDLEDEDDGTIVKSDTGDALASRAQSPTAAGSDHGDSVLYSRSVDASDSAGDYNFRAQQNGSYATGSMLPWGSHDTQFNGMSYVSDHGRHIFVKDTAFQTWYSLMYYFYTDNIAFSPPKSLGVREPQRFSRTAKPRPQCSAKSMYSLATKLGIDKLRDLALASIRSNVDKRNLLQELASSFAGRYPDVLELQLDLLAQEIASPPIVEGFPHLMRRIAQKELSHGADIMIGLHTRILQKHYSPQQPTPVALSSGAPPKPALLSEWVREEVAECATEVPVRQSSPPPKPSEEVEDYSPYSFYTRAAGGTNQKVRKAYI
ncbi:hypothetical protein EDC04DRAFT_3141189 [Pisolithus marmoratus]|nr:hypothetical protein EDC04DRAFT_3141189 [Pisolithus marmoratus]